MAVYKEEKTNTWRVIYRYTDWTGERKQSQKRGFKTKREALAWEREQSPRRSGYDVCELRGAVHGRYEDPYQRKHMGNERPYHPHQAVALLWEVENVQYHGAADHHMAKRNAGS